ncbi:hypothetical protein, partial [Clostridium perfringens]
MEYDTSAILDALRIKMFDPWTYNIGNECDFCGMARNLTASMFESRSGNIDHVQGYDTVTARYSGRGSH